jgi:hypothetical protein
MIEAAFPTEDKIPLSTAPYPLQQSMLPNVRYGNCKNDFLDEATKTPEF